MNKILICQHGGSANHGCEALARTIVALVRGQAPDADITLYSYGKREDEKYLADDKKLKIAGLSRLPGRFSPQNALYHAKRLAKLPASKLPLGGEFARLVDESDLVIAIGGDNYCYNCGRGYWQMDRFIKSRGKRYILMGCSIEPDDVPRGLGEHLRLFDAITVRESLSFEALQAFGLQNIYLAPDSAFLLETEPASLPEGLDISNAVGLNLSPLVLGLEKNRGVTLSAFADLARHILHKTDMQILLVPHVVWEHSDDRAALSALNSAVGDTYGRVFTLEDQGARSLKDAISRLKIFVGARTHATIAAYSSAVPTLALGYSVKARGIARDLFGSESGYVVPVQNLENSSQLIEAFDNIYQNCGQIREALESMLGEYKTCAREAARLAFTGEAAREKAHPGLRTFADSVFSLVGRERCTGCAACAIACPTKCIEMLPDDEGFARPRFDESRCTGCGACRRVCPATLAPSASEPICAFAAASSDGAVLTQSSSGGIFGALARKTIENGGAVFGAAFDGSMNLRHIRAQSVGELAPLMRSKYLQSDAREAMIEAVSLAKQGTPVLFCGTGCQVNALALLAPESARKNMLLIDVVCHGVPSPQVFRKMLSELEHTHKSRVTDINFRDKSTGWQSFSISAQLENGSRASSLAHSDPYMRLFFQNLSLRRSCYTCSAKKTVLSDLTLGDFWGIKHVAPRFSSSGGASLVLVRTERGRDAMAGLDGVSTQQVEARGLEKYNQCILYSVPRPDGRERFFARLEGEKLAMLAQEFAPQTRVSFARRVLGRLRK